jgi:hypothetical protein
MALSESELARIRAELLDQVTDAAAEPYLGFRSIYAVIQDNVSASATAATTSSTSVSTLGATTITVASATGIAAAERVVLDADRQRETVTVRNVSGSVLSVVCQKTHSGTYPVEIESPLTIVRGLLQDLSDLDVHEQASFASLGLKRVDEVEWSDAGIRVAIESQRSMLRKRLAAVCGLSAIYQANLARLAGATTFEVY